MRKPIFESEEEAINFIENCIAFKGDIENLNISKSLLLIKSKGYIRRNPVEDAESIIYEMEQCKNIREETVVRFSAGDMYKVYLVIQYLQNQIVELNKKVGEE